LILGNGTEDAELGIEVFTDVHDGCNITTAVAVVGSGPDGDNGLLGEVILKNISTRMSEGLVRIYLVAFVDKLMSTCNELQAIDVIELGRNLVAKEPASTTWRNSPCLDILRVTPNQIAESALMRDLLGTSNDTDLINSANLRAQTTMNAENFTINNSGEDKEIENLTARLPDRCITVLLLAFLVETVDLSDLARLVVATDEGDLVRVPSIC
jgi:hypothetical protein